jgi:ABC-type sugar transport system ATPase subunit
MLRHAIKLRKSGARPCCFQSSLRCQSTGRDSKPDILVLNKCSLFKFGDPTSEPSKALFRDLTWRIRDESVTPSNSDVKPVAWALIGPKANVLVDAALLGRARADPPESRKWPFLGTSKPLEQAIKKVSFTTRLESNSYLSQGGEFTDYTARYYGIRKDDEDAITLKEHLTKHAKHEGVDALTEDKAISDVATMLKLDHLLEIPLIALSNGQTRRARIARALLTQPEVLILEEPFSEHHL